MCNNLVCINTSAVNAQYFHFPYERIFSLAIATLPLLQQDHGLLALKSNTLRIFASHVIASILDDGQLTFVRHS